MKKLIRLVLLLFFLSILNSCAYQQYKRHLYKPQKKDCIISQCGSYDFNLMQSNYYHNLKSNYKKRK